MWHERQVHQCGSHECYEVSILKEPMRLKLKRQYSECAVSPDVNADWECNLNLQPGSLLCQA